MVTHNILRSLCPNCQHTFFRGPRGFGPAAVKCKKCGNVVNTGLRSWKSLSGFQKAWQVIRELMTPTFIGSDSGMIRLILSGALWMGTLAIPIVPISPFFERMSKSGSSAFLVVALTLGMLVYPALILRRLARMIRDAKRGDSEATQVLW
jgi:hypothetical protein